jgi:hypothetical protein
MRTLRALVVSGVCVFVALGARPVYAQTCNPLPPLPRGVCSPVDVTGENDCDGDGCKVRQGDCNDCDTSIRGPACPGGNVGGRITPSGAGPEICDGKDNNCNVTVDDGPGGAAGTVDAGLACIIGTNQGVCRDGTTACQGTMGVLCNQNLSASGEVCDGLDNNCNGATDETGGVGSPTLSRVCFGGPAGSFDGTCGNAPNSCVPKGTCRAVTQVCPGVGGFPVCTSMTAGADGGSQAFPVAESCDNQDNDCDGLVDDGNPGGGAACTNMSAFGVCRAGTSSCQMGGNLVCNSTILPGTQQEVCDGLDNDCDNAADETAGPGSPTLSRVCFAGAAGTFTGSCGSSPNACTPVGLCRAVTQVCPGSGGFQACTTSTVGADGGTQVFAGPEVCDGQDNDCNGTADNGNPGGGTACTNMAAQGICRPGAFSCQAGGLVCNSTILPGTQLEICDGLDNDCDGFVDEAGAAEFPKLKQSCFPGPGTAGVGPCVNGERACNATPGSGVSSFTPCGQCGTLATCASPVVGVPEVCDTIDNDCDGTVNNGNPGGGGMCTNTAAFGICQAGTRQCLSGGTLQCVSNIAPGSQTEVCDGLDNDCDNAVDETVGPGSPALSRVCFAGAAGTFTGTCGSSPNACSPRGLCRAVTQVCPGAGGFQSCTTSTVGADGGTQVFAAAEVCDGLDNDCNGQNDNGNPGGGGMCTNAAAFGVCQAGTLQCQASTLQCISNIAPSTQPEVCDGLDNDCDNAVDETVGPGSPTLSRVCFAGATGFTGTCGNNPNNCATRGLCRAVTQVCPGGGGFPACTTATPGADGGSQVLPVAEVCDGLDNDCNGTNDNGNPGGGGMCSTPNFGVCQPGTLQCQASTLQCISNIAPSSQAEVCDGLDNDCDNAVDETAGPGSPTLSRVCFAGATGFTGTCGNNPNACSPVGLCRAVTQVCPGPGGFQTCSTSTVGADGGTQVFAVAEVCDGQDNDCNGASDNGNPGGGTSCTNMAAQGVCRAGALSCQGGGLVCNSTILPGTQLEICDGLDNDCDGFTDEAGATEFPKLKQSCFPGPGTPGVGPCVNGERACNASAGSGVASFTPCGQCGMLATCASPVVGVPEVCDTIDNDCNGTLNNGNPGGGGMCTSGNFGICQAGTQQCQTNGTLQCVSNIAPNSQAEVCDGLDNDCDNAVDETVGPGSPTLSRVCFAGSTGFTGTCGNNPNNCATRGLCRAVQQVCPGAGGFTACTTATAGADGGTQVFAAAEVCDGLDNDCNGQNDNGNPGGGGVCTASAAFGACRNGTLLCSTSGPTSGTLVCQPSAGTAEVCDGIDNDCDNDVDETGVAGSIKLNRLCYAGPAGTFTGGCSSMPPDVSCAPLGICRGVPLFCQGASGFPACNAGTTNPDGGAQRFPETEVCDTLDNNCNGQTNEGLSGGMCMTGELGVCSAGTAQCTMAGTLLCLRNQDAGPELCNNLDDNCNGIVDDGVTPRACYDGPAGTFTGVCGLSDGGVQGSGVGCVTRGLCRSATQQCNGAGRWLACASSQVLPIPELCNNQDDDCNGAVDNGLFVDLDNDLVRACGSCGANPDGGCDCNDMNPNILPGAVEVCNGFDDNCDNRRDEAATGTGKISRACYSGPMGTAGRGVCVGGNQECNADAGSGAPSFGVCVGERVPSPETCGPTDEDCDGQPNNGLIIDMDNDLVLACGTCNASDAGACDCADNNPNVRPGRIETCNGLDDNCNGTTDEASTGSGKISQNCYSGPAGSAGRGVCVQGTQECNATPDAGMATFGVCMNERVPSMERCNMLDDDCDGTVDNGFDVDNDGFRVCMACGLSMNCDCDDMNPNIRPGAIELCDNIDQNCNGRLDDVTPRGCFADPMGVIPPPTTYTGNCPGPTCMPKGVCRTGMQSCTMAGDWGMCMNVTLPRVEQCDGTDDDCDGIVDNGIFDVDMDQYVSCALCGNRVAPDGGVGCDCNDNNAAINPEAPETCDGLDNNCDQVVDGNDTACYSGPPLTRAKGVCADGLQTCTNGMGTGVCRMERLPTALQDGGAPAFQPDAGLNDPEFRCDGIDEDCDGIVDDGFDQDGDGVTTCQNDCDDTDPFNKPGGKEICDCKDNNCNATVDDSNVCRGAPCFDFDGDGFTNCQGDCNDDPNTGGRTVGPTMSEKVGDGLDNDCDGQVDENTDEDGDGFATGGPVNMRDCNDKLADVNPGAVERCDGFDNNCDGRVDEGFDVDNDFVAVCAGDCNDMNPTINPTRQEVCGNTLDDNCDGRVDEDTDVDGDGVSTCAGDCNDFNPGVHGAAGPISAAAEICDGQDNNCDGQYDEDFDADSDGVASCFGDCNDMNPNVGPQTFEVPNNSVDDDCDGQTDEGQVDRDMDGFSPVCGDCNDFDPRINPHAAEACNRVDDNCDSYVDSAPGRFNLCSVCFDADGDGQTNCDGDCNDADRAIFRGAPEVCDLKDNDCDMQVDIDRSTGRRVCTGMDAGAPDGGEGGPDGGDGGADGDGGTMMGEGDAGPNDPMTPGVVTTGCGCGATDGSAVLLAMGVLTVFARRRRHLRRAAVARGGTFFTLALVALLTSGCPSSLTTPMFGTGGGSGGGAGGGAGDGGMDPDAGFDAGFIEPENWPCPGLAPLTQAVLNVPGTTNLLALSPRFSVVENAAAKALVYGDDSADLAGFVLQRDIPSSVDPLNPSSLETVATAEVDALIQLSGSPLVRDRLERSSRIFVNADRPLRVLRTLSTSQLLTFGTPTSAFAVRNRLLGVLAGKDPGMLGMVPMGPASATQEVEQVVNLFFRFGSGKLFIGVVVSPSSRLRENLAPLNDFSNGSNLADESASLATRCETRTTPALKTDFLFVIDNTISMVEEQQALQDASDGLFAAFERAGLNFRLGVVSTDSDILRGNGFVTTLNDFRAAASVGLNGNTTEMGIEFGLRALRRARMSTVPNLTLRDPMTTGLVVIFMSDEDNKSTRPGMFGSYIVDYRMEGAVAFAIVGPKPTGCIRVGRGEAQRGDQYIDLANGTGGSSGSICNPNLTEVIEEVVIGALGASSRTALERRPISGSLTARTTIELKRNRSRGFDYEPAANSILFFGDIAPRVGGMSDAAYQFFNYID